MFVGIAMLGTTLVAPHTRQRLVYLSSFTQGLDKVNNSIDKVNDKVEDVLDGNFEGLFKSRKNKKQKEAQQGDGEAASEEDVVEWDESDMEEVEMEYPIPFVSEDTRYMQLPYIGDNAISSVHDGVFAVSRKGAFSFWRVTGEKALRLRVGVLQRESHSGR